ncbi:MAG: alpha-L-fucosidase [Opitutaceae bacterium]|nr:alpha-L-fucosidase [Opitutaceae bacterium]
MKKISLFSCIIWFAAGTSAFAAGADSPTDRLAWYRDAKCGLFIHWGLYAELAGVYHGQRIDQGIGNGIGEWIMYNARIPVAEYAGYARQFNPVKFDADAWVRLAKEAGMKYIVITAKHHDGFAMFKSAASSFNIVDATPFGRDPLQELAAACAKYGIRLGFYYSQAQDWHHAGGGAYSGQGHVDGGDPAVRHWDKAQDGNFDDYLDRIAIPQVRELLTHYSPVAILWWDTPVGMTPERASRLAALLKLQPQIITNNRLLNSRELNAYSGDTETPEQFIPATGFKDRLFEVCMTMNETWGFKAYDQNWKPAADLIRKLVDIASKGGNFLLNVGPNAQGEIPAPSVERLREFGAWLHANQESIYGTTASLFHRLPWGRSTTKGSALYLHVFDWPADGRLVVSGLRTPVRRASLLALPQALATKAEGADLVVTLPEKAPDAVASVIKLEFASPPVVEQTRPAPDATGVVELPAALAAIINAYGANARLLGAGATAYIGEWDRADTVLSWEFSVPRPGPFMLQAEVSVLRPVSAGVVSGKNNLTAKLAATGGVEDYRRVDLGTIVIESAGEQNLEVKSLGPDWSEVRLRGVRLVPVR